MRYLLIIILFIMVGCANEQSTTNHLPLVNTVQKTDSSLIDTNREIEDSIVDVVYKDLSVSEQEGINDFWELFCNALLNDDTSIIIANTSFPFMGSVYDTLDDRAVDIDDPQLLKKYYGYVYPEWAIDSLRVNGYQLHYSRDILSNEVGFTVPIFYNSFEVDTSYNDTLNLESVVFWHFKKINGRYLFVRFDAAG